MNISSVIVQTKPGNIGNLKRQIEEIEGCEFHVSDEYGRMVITIESDSTENEMAILNFIQEFKDVISAEMHFAYSEDELSGLKKSLNEAEVPDWLNDDTPAEKIRYQGDLRKKN